MPVSLRTAPESLAWPVPSRTAHEGQPLGNALFGALVWGEGHTLRLTINRADYWDHRGGITFGPEATYANLRRWLEAGDEASLRRVFEGRAEEEPGRPRRPTRLPMGRVDLALPPALTLERATLHLGEGVAECALAGPGPATVRAVVPRGRPVLALRIDGLGAPAVQPASRPPDAAEVLAHWRDHGIPDPAVEDGAERGGWFQALPADPGLYVAWERVPAEGQAVEVYVAASYGKDLQAARAAAEEEISRAAEAGYVALEEAEALWWRRYWGRTAALVVPDATLQEAYDLGMYKLAGIASPGAPPATLQGPWVEEHRMPPWSADYHFNINVQECYWPAYAGNHLEMLAPLFHMLASWQPHLRAVAREFLGVEDGLMLHHAVDDRGTCMGGFWTGAIDHGATGWVAHMMWQYYRYTLDTAFLRDTAYPFMRDTLRVYEAMLEERPDGTLALPVSVSPEYEGAAMWAWGANASFQLAIIHFLCRALGEAAAVLGLGGEEICRWQRIDEALPIGSIAERGDVRELQLWDGQPLAHSHRHHSHLAGLYPFDVLDYWGSPEDRALLDASARTWTRMGAGEWSGWCLPWAAILWARMGSGERAALLLEEHRRAFVGRGYYTTHDAVLPGYTVIDRRPDIMQIEATMGAATAVMEMLLHTAGGVLRVFPAVPAAWREAAFRGIRAEGAFLVSAERREGRTDWVRVASERGAPLRLAHPFGRGEVLVETSASGAVRRLPGAEVLTLDTSPGDEYLLYPARD
jgi:alpha-L-fucosidase 2